MNQNQLGIQQIKENQEFENYTKIKLLGEGSFGKAYLVTRNSDARQCVMKQIDIAKMSDAQKKETLQEARLLEALQHPNIVKFIEVYKTKKGKLCIIMDYADGGDLSQKIKEQRGLHFAEAQILDWFTQICLGMKHIHDRKIIHRDLKGQNVFLTRKGIVQIGDFGIAKVLAATIAKAKTCVGTPYYLSPEIVQSQPYTLSTDVWSMGVMLYEMCALKPPFDAPSLHLLSMKIIRGVYNPIPAQYSSALKTLVAQCLSINAARRPTVNQMLKMSIIQDRIKTYLTATVMQNEFSHTILHRQNVFEQPKQQVAAISYMPKPQPQQQPQQQNQPKVNYHYQPQNKESAAQPNQQIPLSYQQAAKLAQDKQLNAHRQPNANVKLVDQAVIIKGQDEAKQLQKQKEEAEAIKRAEIINQRIQEQKKQQQLKIDKEKQQQELRRKEIEALNAYRKQQEKYAEEQRNQEIEFRENQAAKKRAEEERYLKQLEEGRRQAQIDKMLVAQRVAARLNEKDQKGQEIENENAERRRLLEEQSRFRQEEAIRLKNIKEEQRREEDLRRKRMYDDQRQKWLLEREKLKEEENLKKEEARKIRQQEIENARIEKELRLAQKQKQKEEEQLALFQNVQKKQDKMTTIQKITKDVASNIESIVDNIQGKLSPKQSNKVQKKSELSVKEQRDLERQQMREEIRKKSNRNNRPQWSIVADDHSLIVAKNHQQTQVQQDVAQYNQNATIKEDEQEDDREDIDFDLSDEDLEDFTRANQAGVLDTEETENLIKDELNYQEFRQSTIVQSELEQDLKQDPAYHMYQEMLQLVRDYSDVKTEMNSEVDVLGSNYEKELDRMSKQEMNEEDRDDSDDDFLVADADKIIEEEIAEQIDNKLQEFTFMGQGNLLQESRMHSIENVREFLESEIGEELLLQVYPVLLDIGDDVFYDQNTDLLHSKLRHLLTEDQVKRYASYFATLIFFEKQAEANGGDEAGQISANCTLKNLSEMTAAFNCIR